MDDNERLCAEEPRVRLFCLELDFYKFIIFESESALKGVLFTDKWCWTCFL